MSRRVYLDEADEHGISRRDKFRQAARTPGFEDLLREIRRPIHVPTAGEHLWGYFWQLEGIRESGFSGHQPIRPTEIRTWAELTGVHLRPWEMRCLFEMDRARREKRVDG